MSELVAGDAFWTHPRPRELCSDCGRPVRWASLLDIAYLFKNDPDVLREFAERIPVGAEVYWCPMCGTAGWFSSAFLD